jgi:hypothetical protein
MNSQSGLAFETRSFRSQQWEDLKLIRRGSSIGWVLRACPYTRRSLIGKHFGAAFAVEVPTRWTSRSFTNATHVIIKLKTRLPRFEDMPDRVPPPILAHNPPILSACTFHKYLLQYLKSAPLLASPLLVSFLSNSSCAVPHLLQCLASDRFSC